MQSVILLRTIQAKLDQQTVDELKANIGLRSEIWDLFQTGKFYVRSQTKAQTPNSGSLPSSSILFCHAELCSTSNEPVIYINESSVSCTMNAVLQT